MWVHSQGSEPIGTRMKKVLKTIAKSLYALIVLGAVAFTLLFVGTKIDLLGYEVKVVQSGSMEPAVNVGGVVIVAPAMSYAVGDIITFGSDTAERIPVTHRIVEKNQAGSSYTYLTKGDANEDVDSKPVRQREIIGKVIFDMPLVGYAINFARTPLGFLLLVGIPALLIVLDEFANIVWEVRKYRFARRQSKVGQFTPKLERRVVQSTPPAPKATVKPQMETRQRAIDMVSYSYNRRSI